MKNHEATQFMRTLNNPHKAIANLVMNLPNGEVLTGAQIKVARERIQDIDEELPEVKQELEELEKTREAWITSTQPARNWDNFRADPPGDLRRVREILPSLGAERKLLIKAIKKAENAEAVRGKAEGTAMAELLPQKARAIIEKSQSLHDERVMLVQLAVALKGKSLQEAFASIVRTPYLFEDLQTEKRYIEETHGLVLDDLPEGPGADLDEFSGLRKACEQLLGKPLEGIEGNFKWKRIWAGFRGKDRDEAYQRLAAD